MNDEVYFWHAEKLQNFLQVDITILGVCIQTCPKYPKYEVWISMHYLQKNMRLKWFFCLQLNTKVFYKVIVFWICVTRLSQSTQNNTLAISLQCLKENEKNEIDFLLEDKHQRFLQNDTIILGVCGQACPNHPK